MKTELRDIEELEDSATVYQVNDASHCPFDMVNAVKSHHAKQNGVDYNRLTARKIAENHYKGNFVVVVVEL